MKRTMNKSELGLGTWQFGPSHGFWIDQDQRSSRAVLKLALKAGIRHFDTAPSYGNGLSEQLLSSVIQTRDQVQLASKFMPKKPELVRIDVQKSLGRLKTDYLDILYLHWPSSRLALKPVMSAACSLIKEGLVRQVGACNIPISYLRELEDLPITVLQIPCSLLWDRSIAQYRQYAHDHGMALVGYSPLGLGLLGGNHPSPPEDRRKDLYVFRPEAYAHYRNLLDLLSRLAERKGCTSAQLALLWARSQGFSTIVAGSRNEEQLRQLIYTSHLELDEEEISLLDERAEALTSYAPSSWDNYFGHRW